MTFLDIFGLEKIKIRLEKLEKRIESIESLLEEEYSDLQETEKQILKLLEKKLKITQQLASLVKLSRSRTSFILNKLEKEGKVKEQGKKGREILYVKA